MAITTVADLPVPEVLAESVTKGFAGLQALLNTGAAIVNPSLPNGYEGGEDVKVPYFDLLGDLEDVADGDPLSISTLTGSKETATIIRSGKAFSLTQWAQMASMPDVDPYEEAAKQIRLGVERRADKALIDAALTTDLIHDKSTANFDFDDFVDAKSKFGDETDDIVLLVTHSKVHARMQKLKDGNGRPLLLDATQGRVTTFNGVPVKVSDRLAPTDGVYPTLIVRRGALVFWYSGAPKVMQQPDALRAATITSVNIYFAAHRYKNVPGMNKTGVVLYKSKA